MGQVKDKDIEPGATGKKHILLRLLRVGQSHKNLLVFFGALGATEAYTSRNLILLSITAWAFFLISAFVYVVNDIVDRKEDAQHLTKKFRPIPAGEININLALCIGASSAVIGLLCFYLVNPLLLAVGCSYLVISFLYIFVLRNKVFWDMISVSSGFPLRALAGSCAIQIPPTVTFIILVFFGSLLLVAGKRKAQLFLWDSTSQGRTVLADYSHSFLNSTISISGLIVFIAYINLLTESNFANLNSSFYVFQILSLIPFSATLILLIYSCLRGAVEFPELIFIRNRALLLCSSVWVALFVASRADWVSNV